MILVNNIILQILEEENEAVKREMKKSQKSSQATVEKLKKERDLLKDSIKKQCIKDAVYNNQNGRLLEKLKQHNKILRSNLDESAVRERELIHMRDHLITKKNNIEKKVQLVENLKKEIREDLKKEDDHGTKEDTK